MATRAPWSAHGTSFMADLSGMRHLDETMLWNRTRTQRKDLSMVGCLSQNSHWSSLRLLINEPLVMMMIWEAAAAAITETNMSVWLFRPPGGSRWRFGWAALRLWWSQMSITGIRGGCWWRGTCDTIYMAPQPVGNNIRIVIWQWSALWPLVFIPLMKFAWGPTRPCGW